MYVFSFVDGEVRLLFLRPNSRLTCSRKSPQISSKAVKALPPAICGVRTSTAQLETLLANATSAAAAARFKDSRLASSQPGALHRGRQRPSIRKVRMLKQSTAHIHTSKTPFWKVSSIHAQ